MQKTSLNEFGNADLPVLSSSPQPKLTMREWEVLALIAEGLIGKEIAHELNISVNTEQAHRYNLMKKLGLSRAVSVCLWYQTYKHLNPHLKGSA